MRKNYNRMKLKDGKINLEKANLLMFLMRLCFNGIYRVSKKGEFTNSLGNYLKRAYKRIKKETVEEISEKLKTVNISCVDFSELENLINDKTFFYLDPPYLPEKSHQKVMQYNIDLFSMENQKQLKEFIDKINSKGGKFILSNSDTEDGFFYDLYKDYVVEKVKIKRVISANNDFRKETTELMIKNF